MATGWSEISRDDVRALPLFFVRECHLAVVIGQVLHRIEALAAEFLECLAVGGNLAILIASVIND